MLFFLRLITFQTTRVGISVSAIANECSSASSSYTAWHGWREGGNSPIYSQMSSLLRALPIWIRAGTAHGLHIDRTPPPLYPAFLVTFFALLPDLLINWRFKSNCPPLGVISVDDKAEYANCQRSNGTSVLSILEMAELNGLSTGVVTTARLTHATPATTYAHSVSRRWENDAQLTDKRCRDIGKQITLIR